MADLPAAEPSAVPLVYATVLYWREAEIALVERCVDSLLQQQGGGREFALRVLLVDNGCGATPRVCSSDTVQVELTRLPANRGFTGGHNVAMRRAIEAGADYVFLVNSDLKADSACLRELLNAAALRPRTGILGPLVLREAEPHEVESGGHCYSPWTGRHRELNRNACPDGVGEHPWRADAVSGCALLVRRTVLDTIGLLDEALFFYFEDMDWCLRAGRAGYEVIVVPRARVWHRGGGSTGPASARTTYYSVRNHLVVTTRYGKRPIRGLLWPLVIGYHLAFIARSPERRSLRHVRAVVAGGWAAWRGRLGPQQHACRA